MSSFDSLREEVQSLGEQLSWEADEVARGRLLSEIVRLMVEGLFEAEDGSSERAEIWDEIGRALYSEDIFSDSDRFQILESVGQLTDTCEFSENRPTVRPGGYAPSSGVQSKGRPYLGSEPEIVIEGEEPIDELYREVLKGKGGSN